MAVEVSPVETVPRERGMTLGGLSTKELRDIGEALLYLAPSLALFAAFVFIPLIRSFALSF